jgi:hypothetical protein
MGENICQLYIRQRTDNQIREFKKLTSPKINEPKKKLNRTFWKEEIQMAKKTHEKMLTISGH